MTKFQLYCLLWTCIIRIAIIIMSHALSEGKNVNDPATTKVEEEAEEATT